jgi:acetyl-CoA carboxylase biotin carboxyl carrier protein
VSTEPKLEARLENTGSELVRVLSPDVGVWTEPPEGGTIVGPGSWIGGFTRLRRRFRLVLPQGTAGVVVPQGRSRGIAVGYGELLFELQPLDARTDGSTAAVGDPEAGDLPSGAHAVYAPTDGVFYRKLSPDAPAFVEVGSPVHRGQAVGLVEVMKTFNQILYEGPDAEVIEIRCQDGEEVAAGQPLIVAR